MDAPPLGSRNWGVDRRSNSTDVDPPRAPARIPIHVAIDHVIPGWFDFGAGDTAGAEFATSEADRLALRVDP
jgi:hypothetical protein